MYLQEMVGVCYIIYFAMEEWKKATKRPVQSSQSRNTIFFYINDIIVSLNCISNFGIKKKVALS